MNDVKAVEINHVNPADLINARMNVVHDISAYRAAWKDPAVDKAGLKEAANAAIRSLVKYADLLQDDAEELREYSTFLAEILRPDMVQRQRYQI